MFIIPDFSFYAKEEKGRDAIYRVRKQQGDNNIRIPIEGKIGIE